MEVLDGVEEDDEVTREAALSDRAELVEALSGLEGDEAPPQVVLTKVKLPAQHSEVSIPGIWQHMVPLDVVCCFLLLSSRVYD